MATDAATGALLDAAAFTHSDHDLGRLVAHLFDGAYVYVGHGTWMRRDAPDGPWLPDPHGSGLLRAAARRVYDLALARALQWQDRANAVAELDRWTADAQSFRAERCLTLAGLVQRETAMRAALREARSLLDATDAGLEPRCAKRPRSKS